MPPTKPTRRVLLIARRPQGAGLCDLIWPVLTRDKNVESAYERKAGAKTRGGIVCSINVDRCSNVRERKWGASPCRRECARHSDLRLAAASLT
ncbi:hypothetical protein HYQ46_004256 [Verticillium longisporum]|nr:hypothetical protein HYQ46_004256 [Verticillium longisporum]